MLRRRFVATLGAATLAAPAVRADTWPNRQIKVVIPYPPGGPTDIAARIVMEKAGNLLGQPMLFDNKGGASCRYCASDAKGRRGACYICLAMSVARLVIARHRQPMAVDPDKECL